VTYLAVGLQHACALLRSGEIRCWGSNGSWQLGINSKSAAYSPVAVDLSKLHYYYSGIEAAAPPVNNPLQHSSIWSLTDGYRDLTAPAVNTYAATATRGDILGWDFYLCATDTSQLEVLLSGVQVSFLINYLPVSEKAIRIFPGNYDSWACRGWRTLLSGWENDQYELAIKYVFSTEVFDGESSCPAGEYWQIIFLKVQD
jgi:hypothetical protein